MFITILFTGVILVSFLVCTASGRPQQNSSKIGSDSNYQNEQQYQPQHHHYPHRLRSNVNSHHHHHYSNNNNPPHHHHLSTKHAYFQHENLEQEQLHHSQQHEHHQKMLGGMEADESNKISLLHNTNNHQQRQLQHQKSESIALPMVTELKSSDDPTTNSPNATSVTGFTKNNYPPSRRLREKDDDDYEDDDDEGGSAGGRQAYLMTTDKKKSSKEKMTENEALSQAFEKHMRPSSSEKQSTKDEVHDVYAYQLPSNLWFVVRYNKNADGQVEKYMNIVDSFTNYLDKLEKDVKTVSVNVKGVETVFRLTTKHSNISSSS